MINLYHMPLMRALRETLGEGPARRQAGNKLRHVAAFIAKCNPLALARAIDDARTERECAALVAADGRKWQEHTRNARQAVKLRRAFDYLGNRALASEGYVFDPRHSNDTAIYPHFRQAYLDEIRNAAEVARSNNEAHCNHAARLARL